VKTDDEETKLEIKAMVLKADLISTFSGKVLHEISEEVATDHSKLEMDKKEARRQKFWKDFPTGMPPGMADIWHPNKEKSEGSAAQPAAVPTQAAPDLAAAPAPAAVPTAVAPDPAQPAAVPTQAAPDLGEILTSTSERCWFSLGPQASAAANSAQSPAGDAAAGLPKQIPMQKKTNASASSCSQVDSAAEVVENAKKAQRKQRFQALPSFIFVFGSLTHIRHSARTQAKAKLQPAPEQR
jgi:hypothetical protein